MEPKVIVDKIMKHPKYNELDSIQKERVTAPPHVRWFQTCLRCFSFNQTKTISLIEKHSSIDPDFKPIFRDLLNPPSTRRVDGLQQLSLFK